MITTHMITILTLALLRLTRRRNVPTDPNLLPRRIRIRSSILRMIMPRCATMRTRQLHMATHEKTLTSVAAMTLTTTTTTATIASTAAAASTADIAHNHVCQRVQREHFK